MTTKSLTATTIAFIIIAAPVLLESLKKGSCQRLRKVRLVIMIDIHCHLLTGVDDGPSNFEDSIKMLSEAQKAGIRVIFSTTHLHKDIYSANKVDDIYNELSNRAKDFGITLKHGYEVFVNTIETDSGNSFSMHTLDDSRYMLIEYPFYDFNKFTSQTEYILKQKEIIPILSHPERCRYFIENPKVVMDLVEDGWQIQLDAASIIGVYGVYTKNFAKLLIKQGKVNYVASNAHFPEDYRNWYLAAYNKVKSWAGSEYADCLFKKNAEIILNQRVLERR